MDEFFWYLVLTGLAASGFLLSLNGSPYYLLLTFAAIAAALLKDHYEDVQSTRQDDALRRDRGVSDGGILQPRSTSAVHDHDRGQEGEK